jgi:uncharacterized protein
MKKRAVVAVVTVACASCAAPEPDPATAEFLRSGFAAPASSVEPSAPLTAVPFQRVAIHDGFWTPWLERNRTVTVKACLDQCDATGRVANFARAGGLEEGPHQGLLFNDSDVYKVLEGAAYALHVHSDPELEARVDAIVHQIAAAQEEDGYLNTYVQLVDPSLRWRNMARGHELYCAGHLMEAAVAYFQATGKRELLDVALRFADRIDADFGPGKRLDPCGHEEVELALLKLAKVSPPEAGARYVKLAQFFIEQRGRSEGRELFGDFAQDHVPVREQREVVGHAVRAMYLYCGMADLAAATGDRTLLDPLETIWDDLVQRKMYLTGGIGSSASNEGFTVAYDLPNDTAYAETCASIGMVLWNQRMYLATGEARYADVMERALYNGALAGMGTSGDRFFYENPLGSRGDHHRVPWFDCSCCPSNLVRFLPALGERIYATHGDDELWVTLFVGSETTVEMHGVQVRVRMETDYPWDGKVALSLDPDEPVEFCLRVRMPGWLEQEGVRMLQLGEVRCAQEGEQVEPGKPSFVLALAEQRESSAGGEFLAFQRRWEPGDRLEFELPLQPRRVHADERVEADRGRVALMRGPLVYAAEEADNPSGVRNQVLNPDALISAASDDSSRETLGSIVTLVGNGPLVTGRSATSKTAKVGNTVTFIPYAFWDNRAPGDMVVWLPESIELAEVPGEEGSLVQDGVAISGSHCWRGDTLLALNDHKMPASSGDQALPRQTFWDHRGTSEWLQYRFANARELQASRVYWFDDEGRGSCRTPAAWRLEVETADGWRPVELAEGWTYGVGRDEPQEVRFAPVEATAVRLHVDLRDGFSAGVLEWEVAP